MPLRVTQIAIETSIAATDGHLRVTQLAVETSIQSTAGFIRVTQLAVETSITPPSGSGQLLAFDDDYYNYVPYRQYISDHFVYEFVSPSSLVPFIPPDTDQFPIVAMSSSFFQEPEATPILELRQPRVFISS